MKSQLEINRNTFAEKSDQERVFSILVVEDELVLRQLAILTLIRAGYDVHGAADGQEAWDVLHDHACDLIVTDNAMPRLTGLDLVKKLRSENSQVPVILASGSLTEANAELKISAVMQKPYTSDQLLEETRRVLRDNYCSAQTEASVGTSFEATPALRFKSLRSLFSLSQTKTLNSHEN